MQFSEGLHSNQTPMGRRRKAVAMPCLDMFPSASRAADSCDWHACCSILGCVTLNYQMSPSGKQNSLEARQSLYFLECSETPERCRLCTALHASKFQFSPSQFASVCAAPNSKNHINVHLCMFILKIQNRHNVQPCDCG